MSGDVELRRVVAGYGGAPVLAGVDLTLPARTLTALLGPSGGGKSTVLKVLAGLLRPTAGDVLLDGRSVLGLPPEKRGMAMVFQAPLLFEHLSVGANVAFGLRMQHVGRGARAARVADALDQVGLAGYARRRVTELSGGQEQRVALARALVVRPAVLLLDEPFSALDATLRLRMRQLVREVQEQTGVTTLFVTHDQSEAVDVAARVAVLLDGSLVQVGHPRDVYERPASLAVAQFFGAVNTWPGAVAAGVFTGPFRTRVDAPDGPGTLVVRSERVRLGGDLPARVLSAEHRGTSVRALCELTTGGTVELVAGPDTRLAPGDVIALDLAGGAMVGGTPATRRTA